MKFNILLVDDEQDIRESLAYLLESEGYNVYTGSNGVEAENIVKEKDIHFAILDYILKDSTGVQVAKVLHKINENIKFMFFSGYSDVSNIENELGFSICEVFLKPIDPDIFLEKVRNVVMNKL
ncbi:response regulator [Candidatus Bathyarchaeota archaeon]|nr:response regulator [Candidatus Bathyarchaeota archaeon]